MSARPLALVAVQMAAAPEARESVARGTLINLATRLGGVALLLAITALVARIGTEAQGAFALYTSVEGVLLAAGSGFGIALARRVSHHGEAPRALAAAAVLACMLLGALAGVALWRFAADAGAAYRGLAVLALAAPLLLVAPNLGGWWLGEGRMAPMARLNLAPPLVTLALLAAWWLAGQALSLPIVLVAWALGKVLVGVATVWVFDRSGRLARPSGAALRAELPFVATIAATNLVSLLNYRVGLFVVERMLGLSATGVYSIAVVVAELMWFVSGSLTQATYARIGAAERAQAAATTRRVLQLNVVALLLAAPLVWLTAALLLPALLGEAYRASLVPLALLLPGVLLFGGASALSAYFTNHAGRPGVSAQVAAASLLANLALALLLVPRWGMAGAAVAASTAYVASMAWLARRFARHAGWSSAELLRPGPALAADLRAVAQRLKGRA